MIQIILLQTLWLDGNLASDLAVEKSEIDLIHVPGVVFNDEGYRIGYGAGYYDRYLSDFEGRPLVRFILARNMIFNQTTMIYLLRRSLHASK